MSYRDRSNKTPRVKPVTRIELSENHTTLRLIAVVVLLAIGITAIGVGLTSLLKTEPGWQVIEVSSGNVNCSKDFILNYYLGSGDMNPKTEQRQVNIVYTKATEDAYRIFSPDISEDGVYNVAYLNEHINETVQVDETLYKALELVVGYGTRHVFMAPVMVEYNRIFLADNAAEAVKLDPGHDPELMTYVSELAAYAADPEMISLELKGNQQVCLCVSDAYLAFAQEIGIETFLDFGWMTNAFIADYLADVLASNGLTNGYLVSYDGFTRNLDKNGNVFSFNVFDRQNNDIYLPAVMEYSGPMSIVYLRDYPMGESDRWHYYSFEDGTIATVFIDPADGASKSAVHNIVSYSDVKSCAEILMNTAPVFVAEDFSPETLIALTEAGIESVWCSGNQVRYTQQDLMLKLSEDAGYTAAYAG